MLKLCQLIAARGVVWLIVKLLGAVGVIVAPPPTTCPPCGLAEAVPVRSSNPNRMTHSERVASRWRRRNSLPNRNLRKASPALSKRKLEVLSSLAKRGSPQTGNAEPCRGRVTTLVDTKSLSRCPLRASPESTPDHAGCFTCDGIAIERAGPSLMRRGSVQYRTTMREKTA